MARKVCQLPFERVMVKQCMVVCPILIVFCVIDGLWLEQARSQRKHGAGYREDAFICGIGPEW